MTPTTSLLRTPIEPAQPNESDIPADWAVFWQHLLLARQQGRASPAAPQRSARCNELLSLYQPVIDARHSAGSRPWVVAQLGQSLDGFVATASGDSYFVNGQHGLLHLHRLRALCDAVLVGAGTVAIDNPQLTTRRVPGPQPVRVVIDPSARLDGRARVFVDGLAPTLWVCDAQHAALARSRVADHPSRATLRTEVLAVPGLLDAPGAPCYRPQPIVQALAARGLRLLFVEGGGMTVSRFFTSGALDRLHLVVAPVLIGNGRRGLQVPAHDLMADCPRPPARTVRLGDDLVWDLDLRAAQGGKASRSV